jgi:pullulanase/glycogen debranching enzyme
VAAVSVVRRREREGMEAPALGRQRPVVPAQTPVSRTGDVWWKNAVFYCVDVAKFHDGNGDGIGDFIGLTEKVDYIAGLGVTCIWLLPFYPSPLRDDGYDVVDYTRSIHGSARSATSSTSCGRPTTGACA